MPHSPTPLPWSKQGISNPSTNPRVSLWGPRPAGAQSGEWIAKDLTPDNAAFVLRAVNSFEAMRAALKWSEKQLHMLVTEDDGSGSFVRGTGTELTGFSIGVSSIRAALALAEQEP